MGGQSSKTKPKNTSAEQEIKKVKKSNNYKNKYSIHTHTHSHVDHVVACVDDSGAGGDSGACDSGACDSGACD